MSEKAWRVIAVVKKETNTIALSCSSSVHLQRIVRQYTYRELPLAQDAFGSEPGFISLYELPGEFLSKAKANTYVEAWHLKFASAGYTVFYKPLSAKDEKAVSTYHVNSILEHLDKYTIAEILHGKQYTCKRLKKMRRSAAQKYAADSAPVHFSINARQTTADTFRACCNTLGVTQDQCLGILLETFCDDGASPSTKELLVRLNHADNENQRLRDKLVSVQNEASRSGKRGKKILGEISYARSAMLKKYQSIVNAHSGDQEGSPMNADTFDTFKQHHPSVWAEYRFPTETGAAIFFPEYKVYSRKKGIGFIWGTTANGERIKLCCVFAKKIELGVSLWHTDCYWHQPWIIAYVKTATEVVDLVDAIPMPLTGKLKDTEMPEDPNSLAGRIHNANQRLKR